MHHGRRSSTLTLHRFELRDDARSAHRSERGVKGIQSVVILRRVPTDSMPDPCPTPTKSARYPPFPPLRWWKTQFTIHKIDDTDDTLHRTIKCEVPVSPVASPTRSAPAQSAQGQVIRTCPNTTPCRRVRFRPQCSTLGNTATSSRSH